MTVLKLVGGAVMLAALGYGLWAAQAELTGHPGAHRLGRRARGLVVAAGVVMVAVVVLTVTVG